jgi:ElaB/YqjD/DUF883 family membrane-anchored ribosome-binding protein
MAPLVVAAIITGALTVIGTLLAQHFGRLATGRDTEKTLTKQGEQLDKTLAEQRDQLDRTLKEQRDQLDRTLTEQRTRTLNERFATAADKLGSDKPPAVRLAGVYAMAGLADDWPENRQTCVDILCGYLRLPYEPDPDDDAPTKEWLDFRASREVRHTVIRVIAAHLQDGATASWQRLDFDFTGVVFDGGDFSGVVFSGGQVSFDRAEFSGGDVSFSGDEFCGGVVSFEEAAFSGGVVSFDAAFSGGVVSFLGAVFSRGQVSFDQAEFSGGEVGFARAEFSGGEVGFDQAEFSGGEVGFARAEFSGGTVRFRNAVFSGGQVDFSQALDWSHPPLFTWDSTPPSGVKLPAQPGASPPDSTSGGADSPLPAGS